jgi:hypothetical protein
MNKKIEELAEQCGFRSNPNVYDRNQSFDIEKFAQLIVRECSEVIRNGGYRRGAFGNEDLRPYEIATMIEEHFGVE